jgi:replicative DNA helicase
MSDAYFSESDEYGLIGACLTGGSDVCFEVFAKIPSEAFQNDRLRNIYEITKGLVAKSDPVNLTAVVKEWKRSMPQSSPPFEELNKADEICPSPANHPAFTQAVLDAYHRRQLRAAGDRLIRESAVSTLSVDQIVSNAEAGLTVEASKEDVQSSRSVVGRFIDSTQERFARRGQLSGITSGFWRLDQMTDGFQLGELAIIAARPSIGKTAIAIAIARAAAVDHRVPTLFISLEMSDESIVRRMVSTIGSIPMQDIKTGDLKEGGMKAMSGATAKVAGSPIHFVSGSSVSGIATITAVIRRAVRKWGVKLVLVDYLQKIHGSKAAEKKTYEIAEVSGRLKAVASDTKTAVVALAQLNRENEKDKGRVPRLTDLADSGQIERDADLVLLLNRERNQPNGEAMIAIAKQRDGECGIVPLWYEGQFCRFTDPSPSLNQ